MGLREQFEQQIHSLLAHTSMDNDSIAEDVAQDLIEAVCAEMGHDWPIKCIDTDSKIRMEWTHSYISGPCKRCGEEKVEVSKEVPNND